MTDSHDQGPAEGFPPFLELGIAPSDFLDVFSKFDSGVLITDAQGRIIYYNKAQAAIDQLPPSKVIGRRVTDVYGLTEQNCMILRCMAIGQPIINQLSYYRLGSDNLRNVIYSVYPLRSADSVKGAVCFIRNSDVLEKAAINSTTLTSGTACESFDNGTQFTFANLIGADPALLSCIRCARAAAASRSSIMICGETGTGKEMLAQAIHNYSSRRTKPFVGVNCAAIPESLQESELFGTSRGAFTGAMDKMGLFEEAHLGSLYLDEIDAMPMTLQTKLLRVLQEMRVRRLGSNREKSVDVRILSSIKKQYGEPLPEGILRKDLYYRLSVVFIELPPLRERPQDIETLTTHFIQKSNFAMGSAVKSVAPEVMELFRVYQWPGNVRELEHVIEGALNAVSEDEPEVRLEHLPSNLIAGRPRSASERRSQSKEVLDDGSGRGGRAVQEEASDSGASEVAWTPASPESLPNVHIRREKEMISRAIRETGGNVTRAAKLLGVSRQLLHYKLKKFELDPKRFKKTG